MAPNILYNTLFVVNSSECLSAEFSGHLYSDQTVERRASFGMAIYHDGPQWQRTTIPALTPNHK